MSFFSDMLAGRIRPLAPEAYQRGVVALGQKTVEYESSDESDGEDDDDDVERESYRKRELESYVAESLVSGSIMNVTEVGSNNLDPEMVQLVSVPQAFDQYNFELHHVVDLPINSFKKKILQTINSTGVVVIHGPTGCGKTTRVPQFILDECREKRLPCNIIVTQPRRVAAINIAKRVCYERGWGLGTVCGYQVGLEKCVGEQSVITYVTTEILLQKLIYEKNLNRYTHIIIDEIHERTKSLDFLLLLVRKFLFSNSAKVKVILMSATVEAEEFAYYFRNMSLSQASYVEAPIIRVDKPSMFTTSIFYIESLMQFIKVCPEFNISCAAMDPEMYRLCRYLIECFKNLDSTDENTGEKIIGSVLVFLPGIYQITELNKHLSEFKSSIPWDIVPMHSSLPSDQQAKAFDKPGKGRRKIILATNIAESSITVSDVTYVIDSCLTKNMNINSDTKFSSLNLEWASHKNCIQRAGRVGRVANGRVYRLVPQEFYKSQMKPNSIPEMQRAPLENIILYMKMLEMNDTPKNVLSLALSPPKIRDIDTCIWHLKEIGALLQTCSGKKSLQDGDITFLGRIMGALPIDIHLSKLIVLGHMFNCLQETIIMAAGCMVQNLFVKPYKEKLEVYKKKLLFSDGSQSDLITLLNVYNVWQSLKREHHFRTAQAEYKWCRSNYVNFKGLHEWDVLINEIKIRLKRFQIEPIPNSRSHLRPFEKTTVLKVIICGAFYPNYFGRLHDKGHLDMRAADRILNGRDPFRNIYLTNMRQNHPGQVYIRQIKKLLDCENASIGFDTVNSSKIFVEFKVSKKAESVKVEGAQMVTTVGNKIPDEVYIAVKKRLLKVPFDLHIMPDEKAWAFYESSQTKNPVKKELDDSADSGCFSKLSYNPIPSLDMEFMSLTIPTTVDAGHFYCHIDSQETRYLLMKIENVLSNPACQFKPLTRDTLEVENKIYVARYKEDGKFYRCKVTGVLKLPKMETKVHIFYIDYGNTDVVLIQDVYEVPEEELILQVPNIAVCCVLSGIQPSSVYCPSGIYSYAANSFFQSTVADSLLNAKVYSVVNDEVHLELYTVSNRNKSINDLLVQKNYAEYCEESYLSQADHEKRVQVQKSENPTHEAMRLKQTPPSNFVDFVEPKPEQLAITINLKGPSSVLETKIYGLTRATTSTEVMFEEDSINSVFLDSYPQDPHARLVVAGHIGQSASQKKVILGQTTVMPNIPGFAMMMMLAFSPTATFKVNSDGTRIGAILCGLGAIKSSGKKGCYPEHDLCLTLDTVLDKDIIVKINELRYTMNSAMAMMKNINEELTHNTDLLDCQEQIRKNLLDLLRMKRTSMEPIHVKFHDVWNKDDCDFLQICKMKNQGQGNDIWPLLDFVFLVDELNRFTAMKKNLDELLQMAKNLIPCNEVRCELCEKKLNGISQVRIHLMEPEHIEKAKRILEANH